MLTIDSFSWGNLQPIKEEWLEKHLKRCKHYEKGLVESLCYCSNIMFYPQNHPKQNYVKWTHV
jgi:hypothetical protein